jgi:hypothetical protein
MSKLKCLNVVRVVSCRVVSCLQLYHCAADVTECTSAGVT